MPNTTAVVPSGCLEQWRGREVVLDVASPYVIIGVLRGHDEQFLLLEDADVHDLRDTSTTRELYLVDVRKFGIRPTRERVLVRWGEVVSLSLLEDVVR